MSVGTLPTTCFTLLLLQVPDEAQPPRRRRRAPARSFPASSWTRFSPQASQRRPPSASSHPGPRRSSSLAATSRTSSGLRPAARADFGSAPGAHGRHVFRYIHQPMYHISFHGSGSPPSRLRRCLAESPLQRSASMASVLREHDGSSRRPPARITLSPHPGAHLTSPGSVRRQRDCPGSRAVGVCTAARRAAKSQRQPLIEAQAVIRAASGAERMMLARAP